jgi:hypothetical protein
MTPREYYRESEAATERWRREADRSLASAWRAAAFYTQAMVGKLPSLEVVLAQSHGESVQQTAEQQLASLTTLSKTTGFKLRPASPETLAKLRSVRSHG